MSKPYKIYNSNRRGYGVVASSFEELVNKSKEKFGITSDNVKILLLDGKVEVDEEYFAALDRNTSFIITENILIEEEAATVNKPLHEDDSQEKISKMEEQILKMEEQNLNMEFKLQELILDVGLLHIGEAASLLLNEGFSPSTSSSDKKKHGFSPLKKLAQSPQRITRKQKEAEDMKNAEYRHFKECRRDYRNESCHEIKNLGFDYLKRKYEEVENSVNFFYKNNQTDIVHKYLNYDSVNDLKRFKQNF